MRTAMLSVTAICAVWCWTIGHVSGEEESATRQSDRAAKGHTGRVLFFEDFSGGMGNWWVEGGRQVQVKDGRLHVNAAPQAGVKDGGVCTVWCKRKSSGDVRVEFDAHVIESLPNVNNINFFLCYSDPTGRPRSTRSIMSLTGTSSRTCAMPAQPPVPTPTNLPRGDSVSAVIPVSISWARHSIITASRAGHITWC